MCLEVCFYWGFKELIWSIQQFSYFRNHLPFDFVQLQVSWHSKGWTGIQYPIICSFVLLPLCSIGDRSVNHFIGCLQLYLGRWDSLYHVCYSHLISQSTLFSDSNGQCEYFIPHYLYILLLFNQYAFFTTSCIFTKVTANKYEKSDEQIMEENVIYKRNAIISIGHIWYPLCAWAYTFRTHYYEYLT